MLIGVELPITKENVINIAPVQLMEAHDLFLYHAQRMNGIDTDLKDQYQICRNEIIRRLTKE
jgi:hypothetical protein